MNCQDSESDTFCRLGRLIGKKAEWMSGSRVDLRFTFGVDLLCVFKTVRFHHLDSDSNKRDIRMSEAMRAGGMPSTFVIQSSFSFRRNGMEIGTVNLPDVRHAERVVRRILRKSKSPVIAESKSAVEIRIEAAADVIRTTTEGGNRTEPQQSFIVATAAMASRIASQVLSRMRHHRRP